MRSPRLKLPQRQPRADTRPSARSSPRRSSQNHLALVRTFTTRAGGCWKALGHHLSRHSMPVLLYSNEALPLAMQVVALVAQS